jgi:hypothetical protein
LTWAGDGAHLHLEAIKAQAMAQGIEFSDESQNERGDRARAPLWRLASASTILATSVARLALLRALSGEVLTPEQLRAIYVRPSDAELNEHCREEK